MIELVIAAAAVAAAVYLLAPLFRGRGGKGPGLLGLAVLTGLAGAAPVIAPPVPVHAQARTPAIALLLIAVDVQRDHLRISEALRIANPGTPRTLELEITLPAGARFIRPHRGLSRPEITAGLLRERLILPPGVTEVVYSYALPSGSTAVLRRAFPLPVARAEVVVRGAAAGITASSGRDLAPFRVGGETFARWALPPLGAGEGVVITLRGIPVSRPWVPGVAGGALALILAGGLVAGTRARPAGTAPGSGLRGADAGQQVS